MHLQISESTLRKFSLAQRLRIQSRLRTLAKNPDAHADELQEVERAIYKIQVLGATPFVDAKGRLLAALPHEIRAQEKHVADAGIDKKAKAAHELKQFRKAQARLFGALR